MFNWLFKRKKKEVPLQQLDARAEKGDIDAQRTLVNLYGEDNPAYYPLCFKWTLRLASKKPDCGLMLQTAYMYEHGHGVAANKKQALAWFENTLSCAIVLGRNSPLDADTLNYVQERIQTLRAETEAAAPAAAVPSGTAAETDAQK